MASTQAASTPRSICVARIMHLKLKDLPEGRLELFPGYFLVADAGQLWQLVGNQTFIDAVGAMELSALKELQFPVFCSEPEVLAKDEPELLSLVDQNLQAAQAFCHALWLLKDCAVTPDRGFVQSPKGAKGAVATNHRTAFFSMSGSERRLPMTLSWREVEGCVKKFDAWVGVPPPIDAAEQYPPNHHEASRHRKDLTRLERVYYMLQSARAEEDTALKVADYCTCFEALFSTDSTELLHKLSTRIAIFLHNDLEGRLETFKGLKKAYAIRSAVVHGSRPSRAQNELLRESSVYCDALLRTILNTILSEPRLIELFNKEQVDVPAVSLEDFLAALSLGVNRMLSRSEEGKPGTG